MESNAIAPNPCNWTWVSNFNKLCRVLEIYSVRLVVDKCYDNVPRLQKHTRISNLLLLLLIGDTSWSQLRPIRLEFGYIIIVNKLTIFFNYIEHQEQLSSLK